MSGHSKWATIKRKKSANDAKRSKIFTKILKEITVAARLGGGDPDGNPRLRAVLDKAKANNVPKDNIERAIKKGTGELEGVSYEEITYEASGPGGVAFIIEAMTDNANRTVAEIRHILTKHNAKMGKSGSVMWKFDRRGVIEVPKESMEEDELLEIALDVGADDVKNEEDSDMYLVLTEPADLMAVNDALRDKGVTIESAELQYLPKNTTTIAGRDAELVWKIFSKLEDHDDVQNVWHDFDIPDDELARLME